MGRGVMLLWGVGKLERVTKGEWRCFSGRYDGLRVDGGVRGHRFEDRPQRRVLPRKFRWDENIAIKTVQIFTGFFTFDDEIEGEEVGFVAEMGQTGGHVAHLEESD